ARMTDRSAIDSSTDAEKTDLRPSQPRRNTAPPPQRATNRDFFSSLLTRKHRFARSPAGEARSVSAGKLKHRDGSIDPG
ncbi:MAG: hypothetical protein ACK5XB_00190, partial [Rhodospirillales bacterium]